MSATVEQNPEQTKAWTHFRDLCAREERDPELDARGKELVQQNPELRELERRACAMHLPRFARRWLRIKVSRQVIPLQFTPAQWRVYRLVSKIRKTGRPVRLRILKARQEGISTFCEADGYEHCALHGDINAQVVAHDLKGAHKIFAIFRLFHSELPGWLQPATEFFSRTKGMGFTNRSQMLVDTAKDLAAGRAGMLTWLHCSELAFWPGDPHEVKTSLYQSVPLTEGTTIYEESTANGIGNDFYDSWWRTQKLMDAGKDSLWVNIFIAWWEHPEYRIRVTRDEAEWLMVHLDAEEQFLVERFRLTAEQLKWRRLAIEAKCEGNLETFKQEYPAFAEEAFRSTGTPYFNTSVLVGWKGEMEPDGDEEARGFYPLPLRVSVPRLVGTNVPGTMPNGIVAGGTEHRDYEITAKIFQTPQPGLRYVIGADVAEGIEPVHQTGEKGDADYSAATVVRMDNCEEVASLRGRWEPDIYEAALYQLGRMYNYALIAPEAHSIGEALIMALAAQRPDHPGYPSIYRRIEGQTARFGWATTPKTRPAMLSHSRQLIREGVGPIRDLVALQEHLAMEKRPDGRILPKRGHDDTVMARAIAVAVVAEVRPKIEEQEYAQHPVDFQGMVWAYEKKLYERAQVDYEPESEDVEDWDQ